MNRNGTYYIGRVIKLGSLNQDKLIRAIKEPKIFEFRGYYWTFIDINEINESGHHYIYARLSKILPVGHVDTVDLKTRSGQIVDEENQNIATSPFVYIPSHSGIAFLHVYNHIEQRTFIKKFREIIRATYDNFFVDCDIELISDLKTFASKLSTLDRIYEISANISPPNPLFDPLWEPLKKYLKNRNAEKMKITENAQESIRGLKTNLPELVNEVSKQTEEEKFVPENEIDIGDAAILMAADGYGKGTVKGKRRGEDVSYKTYETAMSMSLPKKPQPEYLYQKTLIKLEIIQKNRHMEHGD